MNNQIHNANTIAEWFLLRNNLDYAFGYTDELISSKKLQGLLYYAQGCILALTENPLFDNEIQACADGIVISGINKIYQKGSIDFQKKINIEKISEKTRDILECVYQQFGQYSAWKLIDMICDETLWQETPKNEFIQTDSMKKYFKENYIL